MDHRHDQVNVQLCNICGVWASYSREMLILNPMADPK